MRYWNHSPMSMLKTQDAGNAALESYVPDLESTRVKVALAYAAYANAAFRLVERDLTGYTHLVASRQGLYVVDEHRCLLVAHGFFFGVTFRGDDIFLFEACDLPRIETRRGRIVRLTMRGGLIVETRVLAQGLDNGCHQIDFIDGRLHVLDTYNQALLRFAPGEMTWETLHPLPARPEGGWVGIDPEYRHVNSLLAVGDRRLLLLHNGARHMNRRSRIAVFDADWRPLVHWKVMGSGCHGLALLEDGSVLTCGSMEGTLISQDGLLVRVSPHMTRGLAVDAHSVVVGASQLAEREGRLRNSGTITFMDRQYNIRKVLEVPGAPTEVRRLDGQDFGLSSVLTGVPWGASMKDGVAR
jgi:hypothetical protein